MKKIISFFLALTMLMSVAPLYSCKKDNKKPSGGESGDTRLYDLRTDDMVSPVGVDSKNPDFSWKMKSNVIGQSQSAYKIVVKKGDSTVWDSGKVESSDSVDIPYAGETLEKACDYSWTVTVWDKNGKKVSASSEFSTGIGGKKGFSDAKWISYDDKGLSRQTSYTVDFDFIIDSGNMGICFAASDTNNLMMWQINTYQSSGNEIYLRPHIKSSGNWSTPSGDVAISEKLGGMKGGDLLGHLMHMRLVVDNKRVQTYLGESSDSLVLVNTYNGSKALTLCNFGLRLHGNENEKARIDNLKITDVQGNIIYENGFESQTGMQASGGTVTLEGGMLVGIPSGSGEMVALTGNAEQSAPVFRKSFTPSKTVVSAKLFTTALGVYESYINGQRVGRKYADGHVEYDELKPGFTEASDRKFYSSYDVTWMLTSGENVISAVVTSGWWSGRVAANYGKNDAYMAKLIITYSDGSNECVVTDTGWKVSLASAVTFADIFDGESYDARISDSWKNIGFDDSSWEDPVENREFRGEITSWIGSYIRVRDDLERTVSSVKVYKGARGATADKYGKINIVASYDSPEFTLKPDEVALVDLGQNFSGWESFTVVGKAGTVLTIEHGEILNDREGEKNRGNDGPGGSIYNANYRSAKATTSYTLKEGEQSYHPSFTFYGFRYIEIKTSSEVTFKSITGQVVTSVESDIGHMETSNSDINQLISNIRWGQYSNYLSVPTDCPQRDERQGWTADTQVFAKAGCYFGFSKSFLEKFMQDLMDSQASDGSYPGTAPTGEYNGAGWGGTGWADAGIIVPYTLYMMYDDVSVIKDCWKSMKKYVDGYLGSRGTTGPSNVWGDWLAYESNDAEVQSILAVCYYAWDALMMAEMAEAIGYDSDVQKYLDIYKQEKEYFIKKYVDDDGKLKRGEQTVCLYALYLDLLPDEKSEKAVETQLVNNIKKKGNRLQTGFLGTKIILDTLNKIGRYDLAYTLLLQEDDPSWLYSVKQGATTVWERWNSYTLDNGFGDVGMNSFNHYAYGAVGSWMFDTMAGINYDSEAPGFKRVVLAPHADERIEYVKASYDSAYGLITAESSCTKDSWEYKASIPANTSGRLEIPMGQYGTIKVNGKDVSKLSLEKDGIEYVETVNGIAVFNIVAGTFTVLCSK